MPCTFSTRDKLFKEKEFTSILTSNKEKYLGIRQEGGIFTRITSLASYIAISTESNLIELRQYS